MSDPKPYIVRAWNHEGDIVDMLWEATADECDVFKGRFADDPEIDVIVEERF